MKSYHLTSQQRCGWWWPVAGLGALSVAVCAWYLLKEVIFITSTTVWPQVNSRVPMQYCFLQHRTLLLSPVTSTTGYCFCFGSIPSFFLEISPLISSSILGTYRPGEFLFQYPIILPFPTVHGVLKARILKWFSIPFSSGPHSVRPLHHDLSILCGPTHPDS